MTGKENVAAQPQADVSAMPSNRSMPEATIIPVLIYRDMAKAVAWLCDAFGFEERLRIGNHRTQLTFGTGAVVAVQQTAGEEAVAVDHTYSIMVRVDDVDRHYDRAVRHGARVSHPPTSHPYGERQYTALDLDGRPWTFSQTIADVDPASWGGILVGRTTDAG